MTDQTPKDELDVQSRRFTRLMGVVEALAASAGVTREEYLSDIIEGRRPKIVIGGDNPEQD